MHACSVTGQDPSLNQYVTIASKNQVLLLESIYISSNTRNTCIIINNKEKTLNFHTILSGFF